MAQLDTHPCSKLTMPREENNYQFHVLSVIPIINGLVRRFLYVNYINQHICHICIAYVRFKKGQTIMYSIYNVKNWVN
jgi:hypothetical protein